jgi:hypothetical protein
VAVVVDDLAEGTSVHDHVLLVEARSFTGAPSSPARSPAKKARVRETSPSGSSASRSA